MTEVYDSMGQMEVPDEAYFGASTQRAVENFPISGYTMPTSVLRSLALIKLAASRVNHELGLLDKEIAEAIGQAAEEVVQGRFADQFPVDVFQTGSGTSTNMNMNEVIAARANELLGSKKQGRKFKPGSFRHPLPQEGGRPLPGAWGVREREFKPGSFRHPTPTPLPRHKAKVAQITFDAMADELEKIAAKRVRVKTVKKALSAGELAASSAALTNYNAALTAGSITATEVPL